MSTSKNSRDPAASKQPRRRFTENVSDSRIAEANDVWHSTRINDSSLQCGGEDQSVSRRSSEEMGRENPEKENFLEPRSRRGGGGRGDGDGRTSALDTTLLTPIVIHPPSGHAFFSGVLQKCGYVIRQPGTNNEMFVDVMSFRKKLADWLIENEDEMRRVETETSKFLKALNAYLTENFELAMKPTKHETELIQPSLLHCLLGIETLQPHVIKIIMPMLAEAALSTSEDDTQLVNTILNQLKWLPTIVQGQRFADKIMKVVDSSVFSCQSLIIKEVPHIIPPEFHPKIAEKLLEKFSDEGLQLNIPLMDCFSSLEIPEGFWSNIRSTAIDQMTSAPLKDIPAYFAFLFRVESLGSLNEIVRTIREKVELKAEGKSARNDAYQVEILEKVSFCIAVNPAIITVWIKQIKEDIHLGLTEEIKKIDFLMLLLFTESNKAAVALLKILFAETKLIVQLFSQMMQENKAMVNQLFSVTAKILDSLMRNKDSKSAETVRELTVELFVGLSPLEAQTLMGNMTSILVNFPPSRELVLSILTKLAEKEAKKLLIFSPHLMGVLDYIMQFSTRQVRALMNVLAILSQTPSRNAGETNHFNAEFSILLRKQLTHSDIKVRCFGVFGALAAVQRMAGQDTPDFDRITELLQLAWRTVERDEEACGIFLDEFCQCVADLPLDICNHFCEVLKSKFQKLWTVDAIDTDRIQQFSRKSKLQLVATFDANRECTEENLMMIFENQPLEMSPLVIPAHLRVLAVLETKVKEGVLVEIDALLGCPLLFPDVKEYCERESMSLIGYNQRIQLGQYLVLAINFFRESVSAFINEDDSELRIKIWLRLENILTLQKLLARHFDSFPSLPHAYVADKTIGSSQDGAGPSGLQAFRMPKDKKSSKAGAKGAKRNVPAKKSGKKVARREVSDSASGNENDDDEPVIAHPAAKKLPKISIDEEVQPKKILPHLRRFDISVFQLLRYPLRCNDDESFDFSRVLGDLSSVSQNPTRIAEVEKFTPAGLVLLLAELKYQLNDEKCKLSIFSVKSILKYICSHINSIEAVLADDEENLALSPEHLTKLECCLRLLIGLMTSYFEAMKKLDKEERDKRIEKALLLLSGQAVELEEGAVLTSRAVLTNVASYLGRLVSIIKNPATALDHLKLLRTIHDVLNKENTDIKRVIGEAALVYLRNEWRLPSAQVDGFLKIWLGTSPNPVKIIKHLAKKLLTAEEHSDPDQQLKLPNSSTFKSCSDANFHVWYNAMFSGLSQYVYKNLRRRGDFEDSIQEWISAVDIFSQLVEVTKITQRNLILASLLRNCRLFLETFINGGAELLPKYWQKSPEEAQRFFKILQIPCRQIQYICEHSKKKTDMQLLKSVPLVKRVLETLIFRVREVLTVHGAMEGFCVGNLAHRDLHGERIDSQVIADEADLLISSDEEDDGLGDAPLSALSNEGEEEVLGQNEDSMDVSEVGGEAHDDDDEDD